MGNQSPATESRHYEIHRAQDLRVRRERLLRDLRNQDEDLKEFLAGITAEEASEAEVSIEELAVIAEFFDGDIEAAAPAPTPAALPNFNHLAFSARA